MKFVHKIHFKIFGKIKNRQPRDSKYFNKTNKKFIGKFKITTKFVDLEPKMYS